MARTRPPSTPHISRTVVKPASKQSAQFSNVLAAISAAVNDDNRGCLRVRLYDSLPSISVYRVDDRAFVSVFVHGQLAVKSVQIEVQGQESLMGQLVFRELATLWEIGQEFHDLRLWQTELTQMGQRFSIPR